MVKIPEKKDRDVYLYGEVNPSTCTEVTTKIQALAAEDIEMKGYLDSIGVSYTPAPIILHINSYGGEVYPGLGLYDVVSSCTTPVYTLVEGPAMSMGAVIALAGKRRLATPNSIIMLHSIYHILAGKSSNIRDQAEWAEKMQNKLDNIITRRTKITESQLKDMNDREFDWYMTAEEAVSYGVIDELWK